MVPFEVTGDTETGFNANVTMDCECLHCGGTIEFGEDSVGAELVCPHCQQETRLEPGVARPAPKPPTVHESTRGGNLYFTCHDGQESGPFYLTQLKSMWAAGAMNAELLWWKEGLTDWQPISALEEEIRKSENPASQRVQPPHAMHLPVQTRMGVDGGCIAGQRAVAPSSGDPEIQWDAILPGVPTARRNRGYRTSLGGCALAVLGLFLLCLFPVGTVIGIALMIVGCQSTKVWRCSNCGNLLADEHVLICAVCHARLGDSKPRWTWMSGSVRRRNTGPSWIEVVLDSCRGIADWYRRTTRNQRDVLLACAVITFAVLGTLTFVRYSTPIAPQPRGAPEPAKPKQRAPVGGTLDEDLAKAQQQPVAEDLFSDPWYKEGVRLGEMFALEYHRNGFSKPAPTLFPAMIAARKNEPGFDARRFEIGLKRGWRNIMNMR